MVDELNADIDDFKSLIDNDSIQQIALVKILDFENLSNDSLNWALGYLGNISTFSPHDNTHEPIRSSGKFELFDQVKLRFDILEHYTTKYNQVVEIEKYYQSHFDKYILPYYMNEFVKGKESVLTILSSIEFKNSIRLYSSFLSQKIAYYKQGIESSRTLKSKLENLSH